MMSRPATATGAFRMRRPFALTAVPAPRPMLLPLFFRFLPMVLLALLLAVPGAAFAQQGADTPDLLAGVVPGASTDLSVKMQILLLRRRGRM